MKPAIASCYVGVGDCISAVILTPVSKISLKLVNSGTKSNRAHNKLQLIQIVYYSRFAIEIEAVPEAIDFFLAKEASLLWFRVFRIEY